MADQPGPPLDLLGRVADLIGDEHQRAAAEGRQLSSFALAKALFESGFLAVPAEAAATEYAVTTSSGGMHIRNDEFDDEQPQSFPVYLDHRRKRGITVYRRRVLTVEDWHEVPDIEPTKETPDA